MAQNQPGGSSSFLDTLIGDAGDREKMETLQPFYSAIAFATFDALPTIPVEEFCRKFDAVCSDKKIEPRLLTKHFIDLITAIKRLLQLRQHDDASAVPLPQEESFRGYNAVNFGSLPDDYVKQYLPLLEEVVNIYFKLLKLGIDFPGIMHELGLSRIMLNTILPEGNTPEDPYCPYKLQINTIVLAQKYFEEGNLGGALSCFNRYAREGLFPRDSERIKQFADHADPKYGSLLSYVIDMWEHSPGVDPQPGVFPPGTPLPILLDQMVRPNPNFTAACRAFCEIATAENITTFFKTIFSNATAFKKPQNLLALQTVITTIGSADFNKFLGEFVFLPFLLKLDLDSLENAMIDSPSVKLFFGAARKAINACDYPEEDTRDIFKTLYGSLRAQTDVFPELTEEEFVDRITKLCKEKGAPPIQVAAGLRELAAAVTAFNESISPGPYFDFDNADQSALQKYLDSLSHIAVETWTLLPLIGSFGEYSALLGFKDLLIHTDIFDPDKQVSTFQPIYLAIADVALINGLAAEAYQAMALYAGNLNPYDYPRLERLAKDAQPSYAPLISKLLFLATHPNFKPGEEVGSKQDCEAMSLTVSAISKLRNSRINDHSTSPEELKTLAKCRPFNPAIFKIDIASTFYILLGAVAADADRNVHRAFGSVKSKIIENIYVFLIERYLGHYQGVLTQELAIEVAEAIRMTIRQFFPTKETVEISASIYETIDKKLQLQFGLKLPQISPGYIPDQVYRDTNDFFAAQKEMKLGTVPVGQRMNREKLAVLRKAPAGRMAIFTSETVDHETRLQVIASVVEVDELLAMYNSLYGIAKSQIENHTALRAHILARIKTFPKYLSHLLAVASFLQDGLQGPNTTPLLYRSAPASLLIRLFTQSQPGDGCFQELFDEIRKPNVHTFYNACVLMGLLFQHDPKNVPIYLNFLTDDVFASAAAFKDGKKILLLDYLFDYCGDVAKVMITRALARLPYAQSIDLHRCHINFDKYLAQEKAKKVKPQPSAPVSPPPDPYAGVQFLGSYPDVGLTKERDIEELAGDIIAHRSIALPENGAQLSTAFADSPLREVFSQAVVKVDRATVSGPKSLRVLVQLEGIDKLKLFCRVLDNGELQIRILQSGSEKEAISPALAEGKGISAKVFTELNYFVLEILRRIYVKTEEVAIPTSDPPAPAAPENTDDSEPTQDTTAAAPEPAPEPAAPDPTPVPSPSPPEAQPQHVSARAKGSMSIILGTKASHEEKQRTAKEKREISENLRLVRDLFAPLFHGQEVTDLPDKLSEVTLYIGEQMAGKRGEPTQEIFYRKIDSLEAYIGLSERTISFDQIFARKGRLHSQPLPYLVDVPTGSQIHQIKKSQQTEIAAQRYALALEDGQHEVDQAPVNSILKIKVDDDPQARRLLEQIKDERASDSFRPIPGCEQPHDLRFIEKFTASRVREIQQNLDEQDVQYSRDRQQWLSELANADAETAAEIREIISTMDSTYLAVRAALEADIEAVKEGLEIVPENAGIKDGLIAFPQPGEFTFNQTFNQGTFISLQDLLST